MALVHEEVRAVWTWTMIEQLAQDVRYAIRTMRRLPGFALTAILSLAMGIGVNTGIFSLADALLFRPLTIRQPDALVVLRSTSPEAAFEGISYPDFIDLRDASRSFDGLIAHRLALLPVARSADAVPQMRMGMRVSRDFFQTLGVVPILGRGFLPDESDVPGRDAVAVLGHDFWVNELGSDPGVIGRTLQVSQTAVTIVGVAPKAFTGMDPIIQPFLYVPASLGEPLAASSSAGASAGETRENSVLKRRDERGFLVRGRLRDGVTRDRAQAELAGLAASLAQQHPDTRRSRGLVVKTEMQMRQEQTPALSAVVALLLMLSGLVLAIVCGNVANLCLSRVRARSREIAIRLAIGSGQLRLVRQLLTESVVLALAGGLAGVGLGLLVIRYLRSIRIPADTPIVIAVQLDRRVLLFSLLAAMVCALAFGLVPAWQAGRTELRGRAFTVDDRAESRRTAIVNDTFATQYWPNQDAIGKRFRLGTNGEWIEVVGVARTTQYLYIAEPPTPYVYLPLAQHPRTRLTLLVHTAGDPLAIADPLRQVVRSLDTRLPIFNVRSLQAMYRDGALGTHRLVLQMVSTMGLLGLALAVVGLYAVVAYSVGRRMREFGVRMSVGAGRGDILRLVLREGLGLAGIGILVGLLLSVPIQRLLGAGLMGLGPLSPWTLVIVPCGLALVTMAACLAPAWRASLVNPTTVLRLE